MRDRKGWRTKYKVLANGYWEWIGSKYRDGYGQCTKFYASKAAHVVVYEELVGKIPDGMRLDHLCRNRACINPSHLEPVTNAVNVQRGDSAKLSEEDVIAIHAAYANGRDRRNLAIAYKVSTVCISDILRGKTWKRLKPTLTK